MLPFWTAGKKARCPRCYSAIIAPHPRRGQGARNLENDVESVLHPERFASRRDAHRFIPWLGLPRPRLYPTIVTAGVAALIMTVTSAVSNMMRLSSPRSLRAAPEIAAVSESREERAVALVREFLHNPTGTAKRGLVHDAQRVAPIVAAHYDRQPPLAERPIADLATASGSYYAGDEEQPYTDVEVTFADGESEVYSVEHQGSKAVLDWEASVGHSPSEWKDVLQADRSAGPKTIRVMAALDDYYSYSFAQRENDTLCVSLYDANTLDLLGYGYLPARSPDAQAMVDHLAGTNPDNLRPLVIDVLPTADAPHTKQTEITALRQTGWRRAEGIVANEARAGD
jgi:hypothetical protein